MVDDLMALIKENMNVSKIRAKAEDGDTVKQLCTELVELQEIVYKMMQSLIALKNEVEKQRKA